jgi:serine/threonine protein kinase
MAEALGTRGEFRLLHKIGEGGMADVFLAERMGDDGFRTRVALKRLHRGLAMDTYFIRQLVREARLLGQLEHNNIVKVFDLRRIGDEYYVVMEYVDGIDLAAVIKVHRSRKTRIPRPFFFHVALSLTEALAYAHNAVDPSGNPTPLIHRDIKPSNVMLSRRGIVKLTDFGIAHVGDGSVTGGLVQGTANYMSPEQAFGEERLTAGSDVYSLGSVFYEMLTGRPLIDGDNYLKAIHQVRERRVPVEELAQLGIEPGLRVVIAKMLSPDASSRYAEMDNVRNDLQFVADRLKIDLSWHRIRAYVGRLMGILGRAPGRVTRSNVGLTALPKGTAEQLGPGDAAESAPVPPPPLPTPLPSSQPLGPGPATPPTPVPQQRLERSGPVTQAVQKDLLESYIAMASLESTSEHAQLATASQQGLQALDDAALTAREQPTVAPRGPSSVRLASLDAQTLAAPPPTMNSDFAVGTSVGGPAPAPPLPRPSQAPAPASAWDDSDRTRVYDGPTPAEKGVYGTGEMRAYVPASTDENATRPLPIGPPPSAPPTPPPSFATGQHTANPASARSTGTDLNDPTRLYAGDPSATSAGMRALAQAPPPLPDPRLGGSGEWQAPPSAPAPAPAPRRRKPRADGARRRGKGQGTPRRKGQQAPQRRKRKRARQRRRSVPPSLIGALVVMIVLLLSVLVLLLVRKYGPSASVSGNPPAQTASIRGLSVPTSPVLDKLPLVPSDHSVEVL